jgi:hypothetical protein
LTRTAEALPPELLEAVFATSPPATGKPASGVAALPGGDVALFVISAVRPGSISSPEAAAELPGRAQQAAEQMALTELSAYVAELERKAKIKRNPKLFE